MINTYVFDMGNVLLRWDPEAIVQCFSTDPAVQDILLQKIFRSPDWAKLDSGELTERTMFRNIGPAMDFASRNAAKACLGSYERYLPIIDGMPELLQELKQAGNRVYILSNASARFRGLLLAMPFIRYVDGIMISAEERLVKPDERIYRLLCSRYGIRPEEAVFIDDYQPNVDGAKAVGMQAVRFSGTADALKTDLEALQL